MHLTLEQIIFNSLSPFSNDDAKMEIIKNSIKIYQESIIVHTSTIKDHCIVFDHVAYALFNFGVKISGPLSHGISKVTTFANRDLTSKGYSINSSSKEKILNYKIKTQKDLQCFLRLISDFRNHLSAKHDKKIEILSKLCENNNLLIDVIIMQVIDSLKEAIANSGIIPFLSTPKNEGLQV